MRPLIALLFSVVLAPEWASAQKSPAPRAGATAPPPAAAPAKSATFSVPQWAFPTSLAPVPPVTDSVTRHGIPGSRVTYTWAEVENPFTVPDWFPASHPAMPSIVRVGRNPEPRACGYCHLPDGLGRPENAAIAGLPADYIVAQVKAFASEARHAANPMRPLSSMNKVAAAVRDDEELRAAARYFSERRFRSRNRVIESDSVPHTRIPTILYVRDGDGMEPIAGRLIEMPEDFERHELHDPNVRYLTYVPRGSLARGRELVTRGPDGPATACATCHGPKLQGVGLVPPIAGRPPSYILRQLINIRTGARGDAGAIPMQAVVARLSIDDMVALAAYVGTLGDTHRGASPR